VVKDRQRTLIPYFHLVDESLVSRKLVYIGLKGLLSNELLSNPKVFIGNNKAEDVKIGEE
jgi:hypothetical protein